MHICYIIQFETFKTSSDEVGKNMFKVFENQASLQNIIVGVTELVKENFSFIILWGFLF